jgi:serine/threonine-protein kinase
MNDQHHDPEVGAPTLLAGRYRIVSLLGSGGMADVYLAKDERLGRQVAVKVLKARLAADDEFLERFRIEAQAAASLNHPGIVGVYDRGAADSTAYIAMEYVPGESLKQRLRRDGALPADDAVRIALAVLSALGAAHSRQIVHRDVTAHNVLLATDGRVMVTDFGIARMGDSALTRTGAVMGTSSYLSPEQAQGRPADERSDLYSLGVVLYEMLTGRVPFTGETDVAVALQHVRAAPPNPRTLAPGIGETLAAVVMRALNKDPADRFQSAGEFAAALSRARRPAPGANPPPVFTAPSPAAALSGPAAVAPALAGPGAAPVAGALARAAAVSIPVAAAAAAPVAALVAGDEPLTTVVAAEAPTKYRGGEPQTAGRARPRRGRHWRRRVAVFVALAVLAAATWLVYASWVAPGATVPRVVGASRSDAVAAVRREGLRPVVHYVWADRFAVGQVARQSPRGGVKADDGAEIDLWVSRGLLHIPAPDLSGKSADVARSTLEDAALTYKSHRAASRTAPKGQVFRQTPAAGETVRRGDSVSFWVSSGPPRVDVPDVVSSSEGDAKATLEAAGFVVSVHYVAGWGTMPGDVVAQDPAAGTRGRAGDEVVIEVAIF